MAVRIRSDEEIRAEVMEELKWDQRIQPDNIQVIVQDGVVTLKGWVDSYAQKMAAQDAARRVRGVKDVSNDLEVRLPETATRNDDDLVKALINALRLDPAIPVDRLEMTVSKGWVTLKGEVEYPFQRSEAERVIRSIAGIKGVADLITIKPRIVVPDLKQMIERALVRNAETEAQRLTVEMQGSKVILRGKVCSYAEKQAAQAAVWRAPGVTEVDNQIEIDPTLAS